MEGEAMLWMACAVITTTGCVFFLVTGLIDHRWGCVAAAAVALALLLYGWHDAVEIFQPTTRPGTAL
jgi:hypothetical protein